MTSKNKKALNRFCVTRTMVELSFLHVQIIRKQNLKLLSEEFIISKFSLFLAMQIISLTQKESIVRKLLQIQTRNMLLFMLDKLVNP